MMATCSYRQVAARRLQILDILLRWTDIFIFEQRREGSAIRSFLINISHAQIFSHFGEDVLPLQGFTDKIIAARRQN